MSEPDERQSWQWVRDLVREHPFAVILFAVLAIITALWSLIWGYHNLIIESKNATIEANNSIVQNKNATIETLNATLERAKGTIANLEERVSGKDEQLIAKDKQLNEYRSRALVIKATQTTYSTLANKDLKQKTLRLVGTIRDLLATYWEKESKMTARDEASWRSYTEESSRLATDLMNTYNRQCKVEAILLRDELLSRLPQSKVKRDSAREFLYEYPTNPLGLEPVADDLEKLAKSLQG